MKLNSNTFYYFPQSRMWTQVFWTCVVVFVHIDDVPVISPNCQGEKAETEQTCKPTSEDHQSVPHCKW